MTLLAIAGLVFLITATVYFSVGRNGEIVMLAVCAIVALVIYDNFSQSGLEDLKPSSSAVVWGVLAYVLTGFLVSLAWWVVFVLSVKSRYMMVLDSKAAHDNREQFQNHFRRILSGYDDNKVANREWFAKQPESVDWLAKANADHYSLSSEVSSILDFGPTKEISGTPISLPNVDIGEPSLYNIGRTIHSARTCEASIMQVFPPTVDTYRDTLISVWVFWPMALSWLLGYKTAKAAARIITNSVSKVYDGLSKALFNSGK